jgi:hypothetical protein
MITQLGSTSYGAEILEIAEVTTVSVFRSYSASLRWRGDKDACWWGVVEGSLKLTSMLGQTKATLRKATKTNDLECGYNMSCQEHNLAKSWMSISCCRKWFVGSGRQVAHETPLLNNWRNSSRSSPSIIWMWECGQFLAQGFEWDGCRGVMEKMPSLVKERSGMDQALR